MPKKSAPPFMLYIDPADAPSVVGSIKIHLEKRIITFFINSADSRRIIPSWGNHFFYPGLPVKAMDWLCNAVEAFHGQWKTKQSGRFLSVQEAMRLGLYDGETREGELIHYHFEVPKGIKMDSAYLGDLLRSFSEYPRPDGAGLLRLVPPGNDLVRKGRAVYRQHLKDPNMVDNVEEAMICPYDTYPELNQVLEVVGRGRTKVNALAPKICLFVAGVLPISAFNHDVIMEKARGLVGMAVRGQILVDNEQSGLFNIFKFMLAVAASIQFIFLFCYIIFNVLQRDAVDDPALQAGGDRDAAPAAPAAGPRRPNAVGGLRQRRRAAAASAGVDVPGGDAPAVARPTA